MDLISMIKTLKILRQLLQQSLGLELPVFTFVMQPQEILPHRPWLDLDVNPSPNIPSADTPVGKIHVQGKGDCRPSLKIA